MNALLQRRYLVAALAGMVAPGCGFAGKRTEHTTSMHKEEPRTLWAVLDVLERSMPLSLTTTQDILGIRLAETERSDAHVLFSGRGPAFADGKAVSDVRLLLHPSQQFDQSSALGLDIEGACIEIQEIRQRFGELELTQMPRGRSLQESTVWRVRHSSCDLSFAFLESKPRCLARVSLRRPEPKNP